MKDTVGIWLGTLVTITVAFAAAFYLGTTAAKPTVTVLPDETDVQFEVDSASEVEVINAGHFEPWVRGSSEQSMRENL